MPGVGSNLQAPHPTVSAEKAQASRQRCELTDTNQLRMVGTTFCLTVGPESDATYSSFDRWRVLTLELCQQAPLSHSAWELVPLR